MTSHVTCPTCGQSDCTHYLALYRGDELWSCDRCEDTFIKLVIDERTEALSRRQSPAFDRLVLTILIAILAGAAVVMLAMIPAGPAAR